MTASVKTSSYYGEPGGERLPMEKLQLEMQRAELVRAISNISLEKASRIADAILAKYELKEKK